MALYGFRTLSNALLVYTFVAFRLKCAYIIYSFILSNQRVTFAISCGRSDIGAIRCAIVTYFSVDVTVAIGESCLYTRSFAYLNA